MAQSSHVSKPTGTHYKCSSPLSMDEHSTHSSYGPPSPPTTPTSTSVTKQYEYPEISMRHSPPEQDIQPTSILRKTKTPQHPLTPPHPYQPTHQQHPKKSTSSQRLQHNLQQ
jgi:hypothetical protein